MKLFVHDFEFVVYSSFLKLPKPSIYMGGLALTVISPKKIENFALLHVFIVDYSTTFEVF